MDGIEGDMLEDGVNDVIDAALSRTLLDRIRETSRSSIVIEDAA